MPYFSQPFASQVEPPDSAIPRPVFIFCFWQLRVARHRSAPVVSRFQRVQGLDHSDICYYDVNVRSIIGVCALILI